MITRLEIARGVLAHAKDNYNEGWDTVVECFAEPDLIDFWDRCNYHPRTVSGAIKWQGKMEGIRNDCIADIVAAGGGPAGARGLQ